MLNLFCNSFVGRDRGRDYTNSLKKVHSACLVRAVKIGLDLSDSRYTYEVVLELSAISTDINVPVFANFESDSVGSSSRMT